MPLRRTVALGATFALGSVACTAIFGLDEKPLESDAAIACPADDAGYHDPINTGCWQAYKTSKTLIESPDFEGAAFDGRYLYFVSFQQNVVVRFDTTLSFSSDDSWDAYNIGDLPNVSGGQYVGLTFDGRYLYLPPSSVATPFVRYDTYAPFESDSSWSSYDPNSSEALSFSSGTFDGRYLYFSPGTNEDGLGSGVVERYDTAGGDFKSQSNWSQFDVTKLPGKLASEAVGFYGAAFDGKHVYFVPLGDVEDGDPSTVIPRFDTTASFGEAASWELFDTASLGSGIDGFVSAVFDGRYLYFAPFFASAESARFDTTLGFTSTSAWTTDVPVPSGGDPGSGDAKSFAAVGFDGRYVYFAPGIEEEGGGNGILAREAEDAGIFASSKPFSTFDTTKVDGKNFGAAVFDGRYLYLAPLSSSTFLRFDAKEVASQPPLPHYFGSFF